MPRDTPPAPPPKAVVAYPVSDPADAGGGPGRGQGTRVPVPSLGRAGLQEQTVWKWRSLGGPNPVLDTHCGQREMSKELEPWS